VLRKIFVPKLDEVSGKYGMLCNMELNIIHRSSNTERMPVLIV
jgi:hypothetical protein